MYVTAKIQNTMETDAGKENRFARYYWNGEMKATAGDSDTSLYFWFYGRNMALTSPSGTDLDVFGVSDPESCMQFGTDVGVTNVGATALTAPATR